jgi:hypothetical protein
MNRSGEDNNGKGSSFAGAVAVDGRGSSFVASARGKQISFSVGEILIQFPRAASAAKSALLTARGGGQTLGASTSPKRDDCYWMKKVPKLYLIIVFFTFCRFRQAPARDLEGETKRGPKPLKH